MTREFSDTQRVEMFMRQDGKCAECGLELDASWEADHDIPWSKGGPTEDWNGRALCAGCNRQKGSHTDLREWQRDAIGHYMAVRHQQNDFLLVATPGAGKTRVAARIARDLVPLNEAHRVVVVVPTEPLKAQWAVAMAREGIQLDPRFANRHGIWSPDYRGAAVTYAQVASDHRILGRLCATSPTLVILDEVHHCGDTRDWGDSVRAAFSLARRRLLLSGTPFRSDNNGIPFVRYSDGEGQSDFHYGYDTALADGVVRSVMFPRRGGIMEWQSSDGEARKASFDDDLDDRGASERLRTAIAADGEWFASVIQEAHARLIEVRLEDHDAGGLVIAMDIQHAEAIAAAMQRLIGVRPVMVTSDDSESPARLERFADGTEPWIVAVRMVSEGIDIPRLRVGVYATNYTTELFFRQAVGRIVRVDGDDPLAWFYIPDDARLRSWALDIIKMRNHSIDEQVREMAEQGSDGQTLMSSFMPISSTADDRGTIVQDDTITADEIEQARLLIGTIPGFLMSQAEAVAHLLRRHAGRSPGQTVSGTDPAPKFKAKADLRRANKLMVGRIYHATGREPRDINAELNRLIGVYRIDDATEDQLRIRLSHAQRMLADVQ